MLNLTAAELQIIATALDAHETTVWNGMPGLTVTEEWRTVYRLSERIDATLKALQVPVTITNE